MRAEHFTFTATDWTPLFVYRWLPDDPDAIKAVVHIAHGLAEHAGRYERLARVLTAQGYAVYANDHRGHGNSVARSEDLGHFADADGWNLIAQDLVQLCTEEKQAYQGLPLILLGHSAGALLAQQLICDEPELFDAVALSGANGKRNPLTNLGLLLARLERRRLGPRGRSKLINALSFGGFNKHFAPAQTPFDWLTRDEDEVAAYVRDPHCGFICTTQSWLDMLNGVTTLMQPHRYTRIRRDLMLYVFGGQRDPVNEFGAGLEKLIADYQAAGIRGIRHRQYPGARHEVFNETNRTEVQQDLIEWLDLVLIQMGEKILTR